ncbi:MAG: phosphoglycerate dehydrogenase [Longicatena sp.]
MGIKIVITPRPFASKGKDLIEMLEKKGYEVDYNRTGKRITKEELLSKLKDADAIITGNDQLDKEVLSQAKKLKVISKYGVGLDNIDQEYANKHNIKVCKALGANTVSVAEMAILLVMASSRKLTELSNNSKLFEDIRILGNEIFGKTIGILGLGAIGKLTAKYANTMGMHVIGYDPYVKEEELPHYIELKNFEEVVKKSDYLSIHLPLLKTTEKMINAEVFEMMKSSAVLINTARGGLVDNNSLYKALTEKQIAFAAEDIEVKERTKEIVLLRNYIVTPHAASFTSEADGNTIRISVKNVLENIEG